MIDLFLPYLIGAVIGIDPGAPPQMPVPVTATATVERPPEDQTPTGQFTTAAEVKPILTATKDNWAAVRNWEGQDLVYVTQLLAWRCGLWELRVGVNGQAATALPLEPCHSDTNAPNALVDIAGFPPYIAYPENSVETVLIELIYDDGTRDQATYDRAAIQMP